MKLLILICLLLATPVQEPKPQRLVATDGPDQSAVLESFDDSVANVIIEGESKAIPIDTVTVVHFTDSNDIGTVAVPDQQIRLVDGSIVVASDLLINEESVVYFAERAASGTRQSISTRNVDSILFAPLSDSAATQWRQLGEAGEQAFDWLVFQRDDALDYIEGRAGAVSAETVSFTTDGRTAEAPRTRVTGLKYFHSAGRDFVEPVALLTTTAGSQLFVRSLAIAKTKSNPERIENSNATPLVYDVQTVCGAQFALLESEISSVDFGAVRFRYVSDLTPSTIEWNPLIYSEDIYEYQAQLNGPRFNESYSRSALSLEFADDSNGPGGSSIRQFANGIAMKGGTRMVFQLQGRYSSLQGVCGFAPEAPLDGQVELVLVGDGNDLYRKVLNNQVLNNEINEPETVDVDVTNVDRLTIQVNYHDGRNIGDIIHFCDLKVSR